MKEKSITITILGIVAVVAIVGLVLLISLANTGMGIYGRPGGFQIGKAIRGIGSGYQTATSEPEKVFVTTSESQSPSAQSKGMAGRIPVIYDQCTPMTDNGEFLYDNNNMIITGKEEAAYSAEKQTILECTENYFKEYGDALKDHVCCYPRSAQRGGGIGSSGVEGSTGVAYYYK